MENSKIIYQKMNELLNILNIKKNEIEEIEKINILKDLLSKNENIDDAIEYSKTINLDIKDSLIEKLELLKKIQSPINIEVVRDLMVLYPSKKDYAEFVKVIDECNEIITKNTNTVILDEVKEQLNLYIRDCENQLKVDIDNLLDYVEKLYDNDKIQNIESQILELNIYLLKFSSEGELIVPFISQDEINDFYDMLNNLDIDNNIIYEFIKEVFKFEIQYYNSKILCVNNVDINEVEENISTLSDEFEEEDSLENLPDNFINIESFSEKEKNIYDSICLLCQEYSNVELDYTFFECFKDSFDLLDRKGVYVNKDINSLNWNYIITDINKILLPNVNKNKEAVFSIFKEILRLNDEYTKEQEVTKDVLNQIKEEINKLNSYSSKYSYLLNLYKEFDDSKKNLAKFIADSDMSNEEYLEGSYNNIFHQPLEFVKLSYALNEISDFVNILNGESDNKQVYVDYLKECKEEIKKLDMLVSEFEKNLTSEEYKLYERYNLIDFVDDSYKNYDAELSNFIVKSIKFLKNTSWNNVQNYKLDLTKTSSTGKIETYEEPYKPLVIFGGKYKVGYVRFNICEENRERIRKLFNVDIKEYFTICLGLELYRNTIHESLCFTNEMKENRIRFDEMAKIFSNPNSSDDDLKKYVEPALEFMKKVDEDRLGKGEYNNA